MERLPKEGERARDEHVDDDPCRDPRPHDCLQGIRVRASALNEEKGGKSGKEEEKGRTSISVKDAK